MAKGGNLYLFFWCVAFLLLASTVIIHGLGWYTTGVDMGLFRVSMQHRWNQPGMAIIDTGWIFYIWTAVYFYQLVWFLYGLSLLCRRNGGNRWLFANPPLLTTAVYVIFGLGIAAILAWTVLWDWTTISRYSLISSALASMLFYVALAISLNSTREYRWTLAYLKQYSHIWDNRVFVQNGIALIASWMAIITVLCSATVLSSANILSPLHCQYAALAMVLLYVLTFTVLDISPCGRAATLYIVTPHFVSVATFAMVLDKNYREEEHLNQVLMFQLSAAFLGVTILALGVKLFMVIKRHRKGQACQSSAPEEMVSFLDGNAATEPATLGSRPDARVAAATFGNRTNARMLSSTFGSRSDTTMKSTLDSRSKATMASSTMDSRKKVKNKATLGSGSYVTMASSTIESRPDRHDNSTLGSGSNATMASSTIESRPDRHDNSTLGSGSYATMAPSTLDVRSDAAMASSPVGSRPAAHDHVIMGPDATTTPDDTSTSSTSSTFPDVTMVPATLGSSHLAAMETIDPIN